MRSIAAKIQANLSLGVFLPILAVALATTWYGLWPSLEHFVRLTGGSRFVDMQPALTPSTLLDQIRSYSPDTVHYYLWWSLFDLAWPFMTYTAMLFMTAWLLRFLSPTWQGRFWLFVAVAYTTVLLDWAENLGFSSLVIGLPAEPLWIAQLAVLCHRGKLFFNMVFNAGFVGLLAGVIAARVRGRYT